VQLALSVLFSRGIVSYATKLGYITVGLYCKRDLALL